MRVLHLRSIVSASLRWRAPISIALSTLLLAACGGDGGNGAAVTTAPTTTTGTGTTVAPGAGSTTSPAVNPGTSGPKTLVVEIDGLGYDALRQAIAAQRAPALAGLKIAPAWTGGNNGTLSEQRTTAGPGWASLVTGTWANRHGVRWDTGDQRIDAASAPTVFALAHRSAAALKTAAVTSSSTYQAQFATQAQAGSIDAAVDCAGVDACVTDRSNALLLAGYDLLFAQYGAPAAAAGAGGLAGSAYQAAVTDTAAAIGKLLATIARRQANDAKEDWLVILTTGYGLDAFGSATGLQAAPNKTVFIASNKALPSLPGVGSDAPTDDSLLALGSTVDIAPTVLRQIGALPATTDYPFNGMALQSGTALRKLAATTGADKASLVLSWQLTGSQTAPVQVWRDGRLIATLPANATGYTDAIQAASDGIYGYRYTLVAGEATVSLNAQIAYVKPATLASTLINGLVDYYSLDTLPATDQRNASTLAAWAADANGGTLVNDDGFKPPFNARAVRIDSSVKNASGAAGYRLLQSIDVATNPAVNAFTIGFWLRTDASCSQGVSNGGTVIANKNYTTGANAGFAIGLFGSCEIRFNTGTGSARADSNGYGLSAGQWAYVAVIFDKANLKMTGYVLDPVKGVQTGSATLTAALVTALGGLKNGIGLNEDGTGLYYQRETASLRGAMDFNDLAIWNRALTTDELTSIFKSAQPLSSLNP